MNFMQNKTTKLIVIVVVVIIAIIAVRFGGAGTWGSSTRIGFMEQARSTTWNASYTLFSGNRSHKMTAQAGENKLMASITTEKGSIEVQVKDKDGKVIFDQKAIPTSKFEVPVTGEVTVTVIADGHQGGFDFQTGK